MKKSWYVLSILMVVLLSASVFADVKEPVIDKQNVSLIDALIQVESNGDVNAVGDNGKAYGCLQIWDVVIQDVNRVYRTNYKHKDAFSKSKAEQICRLYLTHWGKHYERTTHKKVTYEILARIWNGGPKGYKKKQTIAYWNKVRKELGS